MANPNGRQYERPLKRALRKGSWMLFLQMIAPGFKRSLTETIGCG
jgi:hypothetical protein